MKLGCACIFVTAIAPRLLGQGPPPNPCDGAVILPSQVSMSFHGQTSGCSDHGGSCIAGETVSFVGSSTNSCTMEYFWLVPSQPVMGGTTINQVFPTPGVVTVKFIAVGPNNSVQLLATVPVVSASAIPLFTPPMVVLLLLAFVGVGLSALR